MSVHDTHELWLCQDCTMYAVNGDLSGIDDPERVREIEEGAERLGTLGHISPNWDSETEEGIRDFSKRPCDACWTRLAGGRHRFVLFPKGWTPRKRAKYQMGRLVRPNPTRQTFDEVWRRLRELDRELQALAASLEINVFCGHPFFFTGDEATARKFCADQRDATLRLFHEAGWTEEEYERSALSRARRRGRGRRYR